jgi:glc operon protein GlcG
MRTIALIALTGILPSPAFAQALDARAAQAIVAGCAAHASAKQQSHAIAVVDLGGNLVAALRMDGNGSGIMDFSLAKAKAVAAWGFSTAQMEENAKGAPGFANAPHVVTVAGGVPVWSADGKTRIGGAGASGEAPADDAACAEAGIRAAGLRSSRAR